MGASWLVIAFSWDYRMREATSAAMIGAFKLDVVVPPITRSSNTVGPFCPGCGALRYLGVESDLLPF